MNGYDYARLPTSIRDLTRGMFVFSLPYKYNEGQPMKSLKALLVFLCAAQLASCASFQSEVEVEDTLWFDPVDVSSYDECYTHNPEAEDKFTATVCFDHTKKPVKQIRFPAGVREYPEDCIAYGEYIERSEERRVFQVGRSLCKNGTVIPGLRYSCEPSGEDGLLCWLIGRNDVGEWEKDEKPLQFERIREASE